MTTTKFRVALLPNISLAFMLMAGTAHAQSDAKSPVGATADQTPDAAEPAFGDIVVTAAKRSENLQAVPIAISVIGGADLSRSRINSVDSLVTRVANLQLTGIVGDNTPIFALRGVSMSDYSLNQSSPVATYYAPCGNNHAGPRYPEPKVRCR